MLILLTLFVGVVFFSSFAINRRLSRSLVHGAVAAGVGGVGHGVYKHVTKKEFRDQNIVITGGAHGLGLSMAKLLLLDGNTVIIWDVNHENLKKSEDSLKNMIEEKGLESRVFCQFVDVTDLDLVLETARKIEEEIGNVDVLINNAGILSKYNVLNVPKEKVHQVMNVNVVSHFWTLKAFLPGMIERNFGHVVSVSSIAGIAGIPGLEDYSASKFAALGLNEATALYMKKLNKNIDFMTVCPTLIRTGLFEGAKEGLTPFWDTDTAAKAIVNGMKHRTQLLVLPGWLAKFIYGSRFLADSWLYYEIISFLGALDAMDDVTIKD